MLSYRDGNHAEDAAGYDLATCWPHSKLTIAPGIVRQLLAMGVIAKRADGTMAVTAYGKSVRDQLEAGEWVEGFGDGE